MWLARARPLEGQRPAPAASLEALRALVGDWRTDCERRAERDELALHLSLAFSGDRRETREERRS